MTKVERITPWIDLAVVLLLAPHAVRGVHGEVRVAEQREGEPVALGELLQLRRLVARDAEHRVPGALQRGQAVAEVAGLGGAARGHRCRVEVQDRPSVPRRSCSETVAPSWSGGRSRGRGYRVRGAAQSPLQVTRVRGPAGSAQSLSANVASSRCRDSRRDSPAVAELARGRGLVERAVLGVGEVRASARAVLGDLGEFGERGEDVLRSHVPQPERPHARECRSPSRCPQAPRSAATPWRRTCAGRVR